MALTSTIKIFLLLLLLVHLNPVTCLVDRPFIIRKHNPHRNRSSLTTPLQVGNGFFAFGSDITSLQTFLPYNTLTSWCWHNSSLPSTLNQTSPADFTGLDWWTHGRLVNYEMPNPAEAGISQWMIANPHRVNVGRMGLWFPEQWNITEDDLEGAEQDLDMYTGTMSSRFSVQGVEVNVTVVADPNSSAVGVRVESDLLGRGELGVFFDYPYMTDKNKFEDPFVGVWNATENHTTTVVDAQRQKRAANTSGMVIRHDMDATTYYTNINWKGNASMHRQTSTTHRYILHNYGSTSLDFMAAFSPDISTNFHAQTQTFACIQKAATAWWHDYWSTGAFIDVTTGNTDTSLATNATELQRRIILSQYLLAVNSASQDPPQESGLVNNGWYGKFHLEMTFWHLGHWARWNHWNLLSRSVPGVYTRFLPSSKARAEKQGYRGARWGKMSDPSGRSAPGEINSLLLWQQPHPLLFAEYEYRYSPSRQTLQKWEEVVFETAEFMASVVFWNSSSGFFDLGPPMYPMSENTPPNATRNAAFELAYWRVGLGIAAAWMERLGRKVPPEWTEVREHLAPLPVQDSAYVVYEGIEDMWTTPEYTENHPSMVGIYGLLPSLAEDSVFDIEVMRKTVDKIESTWNLTYSYGWDFPMLAMNAARMGDADKALECLLYPEFEFDDAGYPIGGDRVATPYFPGSASLLTAVAMLAGGWDGSEGLHFPNDWVVEAEGFTAAF